MNTSLPGQNDARARGFFYAVACYVLWGIFPLYWYPLTNTAMPAEQILAQRVVWSALFALIMLIISGQGKILYVACKNPTLVLTFFGSAAALSVNWLTYLWAITHDHILDASLGYFITPLFVVLLGRIVFGETLRRLQCIAIAIALAGVLYLTWLGGKLPVVAVMLAVSFGLYGLLRKLAPLPALPALVLETLWMLPFALLYLLWTTQQNIFYFKELPTIAQWVLIASGIITTVPLLFFAAGAKRISLANMGMLQYISPTMQFLIGLFVFREHFDVHRFIGYGLVWLAVAVYVAGSLGKSKKIKIKI